MNLSTLHPAQHALLADAVLAGLSFDLADEPVSWRAVAPVAAKSETESKPFMASGVVKPASTPLQPAMPTAPAAPQWRVWHSGEKGGVALLMAGEEAPEGAHLRLLQAMLKACGLADKPLAFLGFAGSAPKGGIASDLTAALEPYAPTQTLVLGQQALAALVGKPLGVEGWHAAPVTLPLGEKVGVTYPLDLLLAKPLFKSLAWQHLQKWKDLF